MPLQALIATEADLPQSVAIEKVAYGKSVLDHVLFPGPFPPETDEARVKALIEQMRPDPACRLVKVVDSDLPEEENAISFALWFFWETTNKGPSKPPRTYGPGTNPEACKLFFGGMDKRREEIMAGKPYACKLLLLIKTNLGTRDAADMIP